MGILAIIFWSLFFILIILVHEHKQTKLDNWIDKYIAKIPGQKPWRLIAAISEPWLVVFYALILVAGLVIKMKYWIAFSVLFTFAITDAIGIMTKHLMGRQRPHSARTGYSFPSGHVLGLNSLALIICYLDLRWWIVLIALLILILVIISRLRLRAHYFSDIIGSILLSMACFFSMAGFLF